MMEEGLLRIPSNGTDSHSGSVDEFLSKLSVNLHCVLLDCTILYGEDCLDNLTEEQKDIFFKMIIDLKYNETVEFVGSCIEKEGNNA